MGVGADMDTDHVQIRWGDQENLLRGRGYGASRKGILPILVHLGQQC